MTFSTLTEIVKRKLTKQVQIANPRNCQEQTTRTLNEKPNFATVDSN